MLLPADDCQHSVDAPFRQLQRLEYSMLRDTEVYSTVQTVNKSTGHAEFVLDMLGCIQPVKLDVTHASGCSRTSGCNCHASCCIQHSSYL